MSKIVSFMVLIGVMLAALVAVNINDVNAQEETRFVQVSVLAEDQANYGVDKDLSFPAISAAIIEDKVHDLESTSAIPIIEYTTLPAEAQEAASQDNDDAQTVDKTKAEKEEKKEQKEAEKQEKEELKEEAKAEKEEEKELKEQEKEELKEETPVPTPVAQPDKKDKKDKKDSKPDKPAKDK